MILPAIARLFTRRVRLITQRDRRSPVRSARLDSRTDRHADRAAVKQPLPFAQD